MKNKACLIVLTFIAISLLGSKVHAYSAGDYYNAGLKFYNSQNYAQAIQYFNAAISMDPNNTGALQGRANCYYAQGQFQQALDDYQKVQALQPNPQLASMIQSLQAKLGNAAPAAAPPVGAPAAQVVAQTATAFDQGVALYQQKKYQDAIPELQEAVRENPFDGKAYYYLGLAQMMSGDQRGACVDLTLSDQKLPNPSVKQYADQLKARLSPDDQNWVNGQLEASATVTNARSAVTKGKGVRIMPAIVSFGLADFTTNAQSWMAVTKAEQNIDPTCQYSGSVPSAAANIGLEADFRVNPQFEFGIPICIMPVGTISDSIQNGSGTFNLTDSFSVVGFAFGIDARYFITKGDVQPWIAAGPLLVGGSINYNYELVEPSGSASFTGPFSGIGFGGQGQVGLDMHFGESFVLSVFGGYISASSSNFSGTIGNSNVTGVTSGSSSQLMLVPTSQGKVIVPVANNVLCVPAYGIMAGAPVPSGSTTFTLDTSGPEGGLSFSYYF